MPRILEPDDGKGSFKGTKKVVQMGPPTTEILSNEEGDRDESVLDGPMMSAASYSARVKARQAKTAALKKKKVPVGSVPEVEAGKMRELAAAMAQPDFGKGSQSDEVSRSPVEPPNLPQPSGVGSAYAVNRAMAEGKIDKPITMKEAKSMEDEAVAKRNTKKELSPETVELLNKVKEETEAGVPKSSGDTSVDLDLAEDRAVAESLKPPMDFIGVEEQRSVLINKERRERIEKRLDKLNIADMVIKRELVQDVPVVVNEAGEPELIYTLRTYRQHEYLHCLRYVYEHPGSAVFVEELLNTCKMVCSLSSVNGAHLIEHRNNVGQPNEEVDETLFNRKFAQVTSFPVHMIADISVQWAWFNDRVNALFSVADLKNG